MTPTSSGPAATSWSTGSPTTSSGVERRRSRPTSSRATCGPTAARPPADGARSRGRRCWPTSTGDRARASSTGSTRASSPTSRRNTSYPSILGELLSAGLGVQGMSWVTSPACTELETLMLDWMVELLDLPAAFRSDSAAGGGVIQGSASEATLVRHPGRPAGGRPTAPSTPTATRRGSSPTPRRRPTRASRRGCASPASAPTASASCPTTSPSPCAPTRWPTLIAADRAGRARAVLRVRHARHDVVDGVRPDARPSPICDRERGRGCTSTRR